MTQKYFNRLRLFIDKYGKDTRISTIQKQTKGAI